MIPTALIGARADNRGANRGTDGSGFIQPNQSISIIGLWSDSNWRSCDQHPLCGMTLSVGDKISFKIVQLPEFNNTSLAVIRGSCTVAFVRGTDRPFFKFLLGLSTQSTVICIYSKENTKSKSERAIMNSNDGLATVRLSTPLPNLLSYNAGKGRNLGAAN
ncbi:hypothetical protein HDU80_010596 [Chytriomyces hyalinus]|nr:hypothetical protein HDU80_010596 [Chytriomyces hyalinus]